jgi:membrane protein required for colicin V production
MIVLEEVILKELLPRSLAVDLKHPEAREVVYRLIESADAVLENFRVGVLDRTLGFVFGALRGLLLVVIGFMFFVWLVPEENQPEWITEARSKPFLEQTGEALISLLPEDPERAILDRLRREGRPIPGLEPGAPAEEEDLDNSPAQQLDDLIDGTLEDEAT